MHRGHVAAAELICAALGPTQLRLIPTGRSHQKQAAQATSAQRIAMLELAFHDLAATVRLVIDDQEVRRAAVGITSYTVDTLANLRFEYGADASLVLVIGADQLLNLDTWKDWDKLFDLAHVVVVSRPGVDLDRLGSRIAYECGRRAGTLHDMRNSPAGLVCLCEELAVDLSSTAIRQQLANPADSGLSAALPANVLDYISTHHLYQGTT